MKYLFFLFFIVCSVSNASEKGKETWVIDTEGYEFSKMKTLKSWISSDVLENPQVNIKALRERLSLQTIESPFCQKFIVPIESNPEDDKQYGFTWGALPAIQIPMLQFVHGKAIKGPLKFLEIGPGDDKTLSNLPYAMQGELWCCEQSQPMLERLVNNFNEKLDPVLKNRCSFHSINSDCLNLPTSHPNLSGYFDVIFVQNVESLLSIKEHEAFVKVIEFLLAPGGQAYLATFSLLSAYTNKDNPVFLAYLKHKKTEKYPLFLIIGNTYQARISLGEGLELKDGSVSVFRTSATADDKITKAERPLELDSYVNELHVTPNTKDGEIAEVTHLITENYFTPQIYRDAFKSCSSLTVLDAFFMDNRGKRHNMHNESPDIMFAAAVIKKKKSPDS